MVDKKDFKEIITQVKTAYNIVDYINSAGVSLKSSSGARWKGLCPFHNEKTPSFTVNSNFQNYHCFGCGAQGDIINFVENYEKLDFYEALKKLAEDKNIEFEIQNSNIDYKSLRMIIKDSANFFYKNFKNIKEQHPAKKEILKRGLTLNKMIYGYAPEGNNKLYQYLHAKGYSDDLILQSGVCKKGENNFFDFWNGRLMFFLTDISGKPVGFSGRKLYESDHMGKYVNSSDSPIFDKSRVLYHISEARKNMENDTIYVVEGQFDVAAFVESGLNNVVASSGTAFTKTHGMICRRLVTENGKIIFCFDGDEAGLSAATKVFKKIPEIHQQAYVVTLPESLDPCDYRLKYGSEKFKEYILNNTIPIIQFMLDNNKKQYDLNSDIEKSKYINSSASILKTVSSLPLREIYTRNVALNAFVSVDTIRNAIETAKEIIEKDIIDNKPKIIEQRPIEVDDDEKVIIEKIKKEKSFNIAARLINICLQDNRFLKSLDGIKDKLPKSFSLIIDELLKVKKPYIPEKFTQFKLCDFILRANFFPNFNIMDDDERKDLFSYLYKTFRKDQIIKSKDKVYRSISKILSESKNADTEFLKNVMEIEKEKVKENISDI